MTCCRFFTFADVLTVPSLIAATSSAIRRRHRAHRTPRNRPHAQFDIVNIPPAPKDVPSIEVTFSLDKDMYLQVQARDLDTHRHKLWQQRGNIVVLR